METGNRIWDLFRFVDTLSPFCVMSVYYNNKCKAAVLTTYFAFIVDKQRVHAVNE